MSFARCGETAKNRSLSDITSEQPGRLAGIRFANRRRIRLVFRLAGLIGWLVNRRAVFLVWQKWDRSRVRRHLDVGIFPQPRGDIRTKRLAEEIRSSHRVLITSPVILQAKSKQVSPGKTGVPSIVAGRASDVAVSLESFPDRVADILDCVADFSAGFSESLLSAPGSLVVL